MNNLLLAVSVIALAAMVYWHSEFRATWPRLFWTLIVAGIAGNLIDRVRAALAGLARPIADLAKPFAEPIAKVKEFGRQTGETLRFLA